jgi:transcriptional regulator with XRE-family HTH domain
VDKPSAPLLEQLRHLVDARGLNVAGVAARAGLERERVRRVLSGAEPLTVDELILLSQALDLGPEDLGFGGLDTESDLPYDPPGPDPVGLTARSAATDRELPDDPVIEDVLDPYGNHARQLFEVGFALGCDFFFFPSAAELKDSGVPAHVLAQYEDGEIPLRLDAAFHADHEPRLEEDGVHLRMGFDALYDCFFPWPTIKRVMFLPAPPPEPDDPEDDEDDEPERPGAPFLRLVE